MKMFLCAIASVLFSVVFGAPEQMAVPIFDTQSTMLPPWLASRYHWADFVVGSGPNDFQPLPYRYGFRLRGVFKADITPAEKLANNYPLSYVAPTAAWFKLCPNTPRFSDDNFQLTIVSYTGTSACPVTAFSLVSNRVPELWDNNGPITAGVTIGSTTDGNLSPMITFNLASVKAAAKDGVIYLRVPTNIALPNQLFDIVFSRGTNPLWSPASCSYPAYASSLFSPCVKSFTSLIVCSDGVFNPAVEECDLGIATKGCTGECVCNLPYRPDKMGGCTACGNGVLEKPENELCDFGLDANCALDCKGCLKGYVFNTAGACTMCGNAVNEPGEECDSAISRFCMKDTCTCMPRYVPDGKGGCTLCGNGFMDAGEYCDGVACTSDCTSCAAGYVSRPRVGTQSRMCTLCGNGVVDEGETCDSTDFNCNDDCMSCGDFHLPGSNGVCSRCGNGLLDMGENCDRVHPGCMDNCNSCMPGMVPAKNGLGECTSCGNGVTDVDELCDTALDTMCASDCNSCIFPYWSVGRRCVTCGNGRLDDGEMCDSAQPGCAADCKSCEDGYLSSIDAAGTCTPMCPTCCAGLAAEPQVASSGTLTASLALLSVLIIKLSF